MNIFLFLFSFQNIFLSDGFVEKNTLYSHEWYDFLNHQSVLTEDLFRNYDPGVAPVYTKFNLTASNFNSNAPDPFNYTIVLYHLKILEVREPEEKLSLVLEMTEHWYDPRLTWDPVKYGDITMIHVRQNKVWSPTLSAFGINDIQDFRDQDFRLAAVEHNGRISTSISLRISSNCEMNVQMFPFDSQTCQIQFFMPIFYEQFVQIHNEVYEGVQNETIYKHLGNAEWSLKNLSSRVEMFVFHDGAGNTQLATFEVNIKRNPWYYINIIVFPSFVINVLSIIGVFMKKTKMMEKLNVGLTNIMTMTFILGVMSDKIPRTGYVPLLGIYIILNLLIMIASVLTTMVIVEFRKWAVPILHERKHPGLRMLKFILEQWLETICAIVMEAVTIANFSMMIFIWLWDL